MRNLFGYAATAITASAVSFFAAAGFADQHPESLLGQCFHNARSLCAAESESACCTVATSDAPMLSRLDACPETLNPPIQFEPLPPAATHNRLPGTIIIPEEEEIRPTGVISSPEPEQCEVPDQIRALMKGLANLQDLKDLEISVAAPFMPYCDDDEPAPAIMPNAEQTRIEKVGGSFLEFWTSFFRPPGSDAAPDCKEDPAIHQQYPGVPVSERRKSGKPRIAPFEEELQEISPLPKPDFKQLLKPEGAQGNSKKRSHLDTTECRPTDFGFDNLGLRPF